jgi:hypothetical protein
MGIGFLFFRNGLYGSEELFDRGILQYEFLDAASDKLQNLFFRRAETQLACNSTFGAKLLGRVSSLWYTVRPCVFLC